jgi:hypothetical protein
VILLIPASSIARIIAVSHWHLVRNIILFMYFSDDKIGEKNGIVKK